MNTAPIAPVLQRIATIESRFRPASTSQMVVRQPESAGDVDFSAALDRAVSATSLPAPTVAMPTAGATWAGATGTGIAATPTWPVATTATTTDPITGATVAVAAPAGASGGLDGPVTPGTPFAAEFEAAGQRYGVPPRLLAAVGWVESRYSTTAVSPAGAIGLMQIMPGTAQGLGVDPRDPLQAIDGAARLLADHAERFGSWDLALAAYHSGAGAVSRNGNVPPPRAAAYVTSVTQRLEQS